MRRLFKIQRGDTMIEVLIATAVISSILGGAYTLATSALKSARVAQERTEALKLTEGQVERLRFAARTTGRFDSDYRDTSNSYCIDIDPQGNVLKRPNSTECAPGTIYRLSIAYTPNNISPVIPFGTFEIRADWDGLRGRPERLVINYQL